MALLYNYSLNIYNYYSYTNIVNIKMDTQLVLSVSLKTINNYDDEV